MRITLATLGFLLASAVAGLEAATPPPVRVLVWDEQQPEQKRAYGEQFLGESIAAHLAGQPGFTVKSASLDSHSQGLDEVALDDADVVIWWSHVKNPFVTDANVERIVTRCVWKVGKGRVFYFRPGHETYPVFKQAEPLRVVENAARWLGRGNGARNSEPAATSAARFDPVLRDLEGWKVHVEPTLLDGEHREEGGKALAMLVNHLQRIRILVPADRLAQLQTIEIWIEHDHPRMKSMQYHPSREWLVNNGHDPRLARKVHITQARDLLSRSQMLKHPAVVLHELAHGYHDQFLGFDQPQILAAYQHAVRSGSYTNVLLYTGQKVKHYALTDHKEYFAEGTEAYFYRNDFHPFVRAELKEHDPGLHEVLVNVWGAIQP